ncbi:MAG: hypothetical protein JXQ87_06270 [Bacteroidia bacterium]
MKKLLVFISISLSSIFSALACGPFYPFGDEVRFGMLQLENVGLSDYGPFNYTWENWFWRNREGIEDIETIGRNMNLKLWAKRYNYKGELDEVLGAVYSYQETSLANYPDNEFVKLMHQKADKAAIEYLDFAKSCEQLNDMRVADPWERGRDVNQSRNKFIDQALEKAEQSKDKELERRYAFIAIRLAFYAELKEDYWSTKKERVEAIYKTYFDEHNAKDIIDSWALYYWAKLHKTGPRQNFLLANSFLKAIDKRVAISREFYRKMPIDSTLMFAKTNLEKANVLLVYAVRKLDHSTDVIKQMHELSPGFKGTDFLLIRELSKLEDWILTPKYTNFDPAIASNNTYNYTSTLEKNRIEKDLVYAKNLLAFVQKVELNKVYDQSIWLLAKAYLHYMLADYENSFAVSNEFISAFKSIESPCWHQFEMINQLSKVAIESSSKPIDNALKQLVLDKAKSNENRFLFALARELEFNGNTTDAAIILSRLSNNWRRGTPVFWRTDEGHHTLYGDFYDDYFFYMDAQYTPEQVESLLKSIGENKESDDLNRSYYKTFDEAEVSRIKDLLGTKYFRINELEKSQKVFSKIIPSYWTSKWQYNTYLDDDPFVIAGINDAVGEEPSKKTYSKTEIVAELLEHLNKAKDTKNKERAYHYFMAANCYLNTSYHGNAWMLRRYFKTSNISNTGLPDDDEYFESNLAEALYLKAAQFAKTKDFEALSYKMAGSCFDNGIIFGDRKHIRYLNFEERYKQNPYYLKFEDEFKDYHEDYFELCYGFHRCFENR